MRTTPPVQQVHAPLLYYSASTDMMEMEAQKSALEEQSKRLERMARGDQESAQELVSFLMEQGMTIEEVEEMMTNPDEAGMEKLKLAMEKAFDPEQFDSVFQNIVPFITPDLRCFGVKHCPR